MEIKAVTYDAAIGVALSVLYLLNSFQAALVSIVSSRSTSQRHSTRSTTSIFRWELQGVTRFELTAATAGFS